MLTGGEDIETDLFCLQGIVTIALIRSASDGVRPLVRSVVRSPTLNTPNCISTDSWAYARFI
jgi:hypothetical protein